MHIRTFRAANLNAALGMIREQMGPDASVLHTRQLSVSPLNLFGRPRVEVTAGLKHLRAERPDERLRVRVPPACVQQGAPENQGAAEPEMAERFAERASGAPVDRRIASAVIDELNVAGVPTKIAEGWIERASREHRFHSTGGPASAEPEPKTLGTIRSEISDWLARSIRRAAPVEIEPGSRRVIALVGPTGVGKTTTIAKLAAGFQLDQNVRVALMTMDTFRAGAIEQLDAFAQTMQIPLEVVSSMAQVADAMDRLAEFDVILVDTIGQSPRGAAKLDAMGRLLAAVAPDETHLVIDANCSTAAALDVLSAFGVLRPSAAILSKIDEVQQPAPVIAALLQSPLGISYVTSGQRVPEDIAEADIRSLADAASGLAAYRSAA